MKEQLRRIYQRLLDDAEEAEPKDRYYKLSDKDLLGHINALSELFEAKQNRTTAGDVGKDTAITVTYVNDNHKSDTVIQTDEPTETPED